MLQNDETVTKLIFRSIKPVRRLEFNVASIDAESCSYIKFNPAWPNPGEKTREIAHRDARCTDAVELFDSELSTRPEVDVTFIPKT